MFPIPLFRLKIFVPCAFILLVLLAWLPLQALDRNTSIRHFGKRVWQTDEGLPQNTVTSILQTSDGYLWIGTEGGLARFDGIQFAVFNRRTTPQLHSNEINNLYEDRHGVLWVSTGDGLTSYDGSRWSIVTAKDGLPGNNVSSVYEDRNGVLWILTASGLASDKQGKIHAIAAQDGLTSGSVLSVLDDIDGTLWIATSDGIGKLKNGRIAPMYKGAVNALAKNPAGGLWVSTQQGFTFIQHGAIGSFFSIPSVSNSDVDTLFAAQDGSLWIGTSVGLAVWNKQTAANYTTANGLPSNSIHSIYQDREGSVWISTAQGLARFVDGAVQPFTTANGLSAPFVLSLFEDREGNLWLGTDAGGVMMLRNQKFISYTAADGLAGENTKAVLEDRSHAVWIGTDGNGLSRLFQQRFTTVNTSNGLSSDVVLALAEDSQGGLWIGTPDGLNHLQDGRITRVTSADGLADDFIRSILPNEDGSLWVGTRHGLSYWKNGVATTYTEMDGLSGDFIGALEKDKNGNLWIGTMNGLNEWKDGKFYHYSIKDGLSNNVITSLYVDFEGTLWIGTKGGGLNRFKNGTLFRYGTLTAIPENIYGLIADNSESLWISSDRGIYSIHIAALNAYAKGDLKSPDLRAYGKADGMPTSQCSSGGHPSLWRSGDGRLWFTTPRGVTSIQPEQAAYNQAPPPVVIEQVSIDDTVVSSRARLVVRPGHTRYAFRYAGLSFTAPQKVRFRYRLEGFDKSWIDAGTRRQAYYTNLKPGNYRFHVLAENNDNVWNESGASFYFTVQPHLYQSMWFYIAVCFVLILLGYELYRLRMRQVKLQFHAVLTERNRIAREIHDTLAQGFVGVSLQVEIAKRMLANSNQQVKDHLEQALSLVNSSLSEARRSIWDLRSQASENRDIPSRLSDMIKQVRQQSTVEIGLDISGAYRLLPERTGNELLKIAQEATINAVRHAKANHIRVLLSYEEAHVCIVVSDDGLGFTPDERNNASASGHYGLTGMQERAKLIHAKLSIESEKSEGTRVTLNISA